MAQDDTKARLGRRAFFGAAAAASAGALAAGGARPALAQQTGDERTRARYRETEHVLKFYQTNRYTRTEG
jgi:nitrous oxide reductase